MRSFPFACGLLVILAAAPAIAQTPDSTATGSAPAPAAVTPPPAAAPVAAAPAPAKPAAPAPEKKLYFGGGVGVTFGSYTRISISPLVGYPLNPKVSIGARGTYEYIHDTRFSPDLSASNYGGSAFTRFRFHPLAYLHAEYSYMSYEYQQAFGGSTRTWVPFLYLGGGVMKPLGPRTAAFVEVLFDVLQDKNSPYEAWQPMISVGVTSGF